MMKLKIEWGLRVRRHEERIRLGRAGNIVRECWTEKKYGWKNRYGEERERYFNRIGWEEEVKKRTEWNRDDVEKEIRKRKKHTERKEEEEIIKNPKYNTRHKEINDFEECMRNIKVENLKEINKGDEVRALIKLRYGNLENANKYWLNEENWRCVFCEKGKNSIEHYVRECNKVKA